MLQNNSTLETKIKPSVVNGIRGYRRYGTHAIRFRRAIIDFLYFRMRVWIEEFCLFGRFDSVFIT